MTEQFRFSRLSIKHKKWFIIHQISLLTALIVLTYIAVAVTNPVIIEREDKMSVSVGAFVGIFIFLLAFTNRIKSWIKIKFVMFLVIWILLLSLQLVMDTMIWAIGLNLIPLMIDDMILLPIWRNVWYNQYEQ
jgi:hypothetical protein